ncbi:MAG: hypothetical protein ACE5GE_16880, partial [Phycisphaerae bacterium]
TIELGLKQYVSSRRRLRGGQVVCLFGHSPFVLKEVVKWLRGASLFWLDAHYSGGGTARGPTECPLLAELDAVCGHGHCILIDDAPLFRREVPLNGHRPEDWPTVADIEAKLCPGERLYHLPDQILITPREYSGCPTP